MIYESPEIGCSFILNIIIGMGDISKLYMYRHIMISYFLLYAISREFFEFA